ncbi:MAG: hypothetical protein ACP5U0_08475 [Caldisphaera sp.]
MESVLWLFAKLMPLYSAEKLYYYFTLVAFIFSSFRLSDLFTKNFFLKSIGVSFLIFNPATISIVAGGEPETMLSFAFLFGSIYFMFKETQIHRRPPSIGWILSWIFIILTIYQEQIFVLGFPLYLLILFFNVIIDNKEKLQTKIKDFIFDFSFTITMVVLLILPDIIPLYLNGYAGAFFSNPARAIYQFYASPISLMLLEPSFIISSLLTYGKLFPIIWEFATLIALILIITGSILFNKKWGLYYAIIITTAAMIGAGPASPFFKFVKLLYNYIPGLISVNASYYWDWTIVAPAYFLLLMSLFSGFRFPKSKFQGFESKIKVKKLFLIILTFLLIFSMVVPVGAQAYYGANGINNQWGKYMPASYSQIYPALSKLMQNTSGAVAVFPPDYQLYFFNISDWFLNPLLAYPHERTVILSSYPFVWNTETKYFYWVYRLFYENRTQYIGQFMALGGVKYFVVLTNAQSGGYDGNYMPFSDGMNASQLMAHQLNVYPVYFGNGFTIYKNGYYSGAVQSYSSFSLLAGGYNELTYLPYFGFNLTNFGLISMYDLNPSNFWQVINSTSQIFTPSTNYLNGLILHGISNPIYAAEYVNESAPQNPSQIWINYFSTYISFYPGFMEPYPVAVTDSKSSLLVPINVKQAGNYSIYIEMRYSSDSIFPGGKLEVSLGNNAWVFNTSSGYDGLTNTFVYQNITSYLKGNQNLNITSLSGWNAVGEIFIIPKGSYQRAYTEFNKAIQLNNITIYQIVPGNELATNLTEKGIIQIDGNSLGTSPNALIPNGQMAFMQNTNSKLDSLQLQTISNSGTLYFMVQDTDGGVLNISGRNFSKTFGFSTGLWSDPYHVNSSYIAVPTSSSSSNYDITLINGNVYIDGLVFVKTPPNLGNRLPSVTKGLLNYYVPCAQNITNFSYNVSSEENTVTLKFSFLYTGSGKSCPLISVMFNATPYYNAPVYLKANVTPGFYLSTNIGVIGSNTQYCLNPSLFQRNVSGYIYVDVVPYSLPVNAAKGKLINVSLELFFIKNTTFIKEQSQTVSRGRVIFTNDGYQVDGLRDITMVRLLYNPNLKSSNNSVDVFPSMFGISETILNANGSLKVGLSYVNLIIMIFLVDLLLLGVLSIYSLRRW